jgi:hypothetical protein
MLSGYLQGNANDRDQMWKWQRFAILEEQMDKNKSVLSLNA